MLKKIVLCCAVFAAIGMAVDNWAVVISGAGDYHNYSIQSVSCRITHMVINNGIPKDHVIHLSLDDIAWLDENPLKGKLFAQKNGPNVREDCQIDYLGPKEDTKANFFNVLKGDSAATGGKKVLKSTKDSNVFIYYIDHGNRGIIAMPDETVYADELNEVLKYMHDNNMYRELVFYMTACHGGSMFHKLLPEDIKIFAMTSASPDESSYMAHCPPFDDVAEGQHMNVCLGDEVSEVWAGESETGNRKTTIAQQVKMTKKAITASIVSSYGDESFNHKPIQNYVGAYQSESNADLYWTMFGAPKYINDVKPVEGEKIDATNLQLAHLYAKVIQNGGHKAQLDLMELLNHRVKIDHVMKDFEFSVGVQDKTPSEYINFDCLRSLVNTFKSTCGTFDEYVMSKVDSLIKGCDSDSTIEKLQSALSESCSH